MKRLIEFEKFKQEYKKDFDIPVLSAKGKEVIEIQNKNDKNKKKGHSEFHKRTQRVPLKDTGLKVDFFPGGIILYFILFYFILFYFILLLPPGEN